MKTIVIFGAGGHGKVAADIIEKEGKFKIIGFLDGGKTKNTDFFGYKIVGDEDYFANRNHVKCLVAIGDNWTRSIVVGKILNINPTIQFINAIHPSAQIGRGVRFGHGNVVMANTVINSDAVVGNHSIVNTKSSLGHDGLLGNFATIAPGATIGGETVLKDFSTVSIGATVSHGITIGKHTVIGAGSVVLNNIADHQVVYGTPARTVRYRVESDKYL